MGAGVAGDRVAVVVALLAGVLVAVVLGVVVAGVEVAKVALAVVEAGAGAGPDDPPLPQPMEFTKLEALLCT